MFIKWKKVRRVRRRRLYGILLFAFGAGMSLGLLLATWAFVMAALIIIVGFWLMLL